MLKTLEAKPIAAAEQKARPLTLPGRWDALGIALLAAALLLCSYLQSRQRMFWGDEMMGVYVLDAGSWAHFLERWRSGIDSSGFWFYVFAKPWEWIFGPATALRLRLFSAAGVATSAGLIWITARRFYSLPIVAVSVSLVFFDINVLRWQLSNGRCYGVFLAATALVLFLLFKGEEEAYRRPSPWFLAGTALAYDILAGAHILGMVYAGALLAIQIALDLRARRLRLSLYAAAIAGIVVIFGFSLGNIRTTTALGKPAFWTTRPSMHDLLLSSDFSSSAVRTVLLVLLALSFFSLRKRPARVPVYIVLFGFVLLDVAFFAISALSTSIYVDRYLVPFAFALILLCAELLTQLREADLLHPRLRAAAPVLVALYGVHLFPPLHSYPFPYPDYTGSLLARLPPGLPVVDTDVASFVEVEFYHHGHIPQPFLFPIDPEVTLDPHNLGGVSGFHEMDNFRRLGLDTPDLQPTSTILSGPTDLLVITGSSTRAWLQRRLLDTGRYDVRDLGPLPGAFPLHLWQAHLR